MVLPFGRSEASKTVSQASRYLNDASKALGKGDFLGAAAAYTNAMNLMKSVGSYAAGLSGREMRGYHSLLSTQRQVGAGIVRLGMSASDGYLKPVAHTVMTAKKMIERPPVSRSREGISAEVTRNVDNATEYLKTVNPLVESTMRTAENTAKLTAIIADDLNVQELASRAHENLAKVKKIRLFLEGSPA